MPCRIPILVTLALAAMVGAQPFGANGRMTPVPRNANGSGFGYYEYVPSDYAADRKWPVVFYFHGVGEKGNGTTDLKKLLTTGVPALFAANTDGIPSNDVQQPFLLLAPQDSTGWPNIDRVWAFIEFAKSRYSLDTNRLYATGVSAGGGTVWSLLTKYGDRFAAAAPICGSGSVGSAATVLRGVPIWAAHSFDDPTVPLRRTLANVDRIAQGSDSAIRAYPSGSAKVVSAGTQTLQYDTTVGAWKRDSGFVPPRQRLALTIYPKGGHDSWTRTYGRASFWTWLLAQDRANPPSESTPDEIVPSAPAVLHLQASGLDLGSAPTAGRLPKVDASGRRSP